ncbi:MAG: 2-oxoacid:acceptor oxidoreductase subunit alpha [Candidatus Obscuribacter phosphatis]|uniref:2-oxoacid:acceptor oxidoreductase subunit alpha n=1 Tax=Candidatus Obscuribacter phosphatis TaxID=1906157 RepID=A0A8J7PPR3_9BACT|nr:2-oxoacid:acceptor oxidoreductase subunit alpha [Candidatus Obscuribacter phosphatis]
MKTLAADSKEKLEKGRIVNDFSIQVATVNGSGSQSSNNVLMRSIFQMGIPVSGKNLFPSNIAGLPTWFTIRVNKNGYIARKEEIDILVAMNPQTAIEDVKSLRSGAVCISPVELKLDAVRSDVKHYQVPFSELAAKASENLKLRKLLTNMIYVGVVAELLDITHSEIENAIAKQFEGKAKAVDLNLNAVKLGREWAKENLTKEDNFVVEPMDKTKGKIIIDGNAAAALGCMFAGVTVVAWYPITPSSSLCEQLIDYLKEHRIDKETGKASFAVVQAEDELAAIGMTLGAGWAGARSMTSTSGPGISLMSEFAGYGYFTEIPAVIFDVQRVGPSTGMPTRTSQADLTSTFLLSHGDTKHIILLPGSVAECYEMAMEAFELAEKFQTPVFVLTDLDLGMNNWMSDPFEYPTKPINRGKVLDAAALEKAGKFERYADIDGDGIPYRTLPGTDHPLAAYFTRGSGHTEKATYTERPEDYVNLMNRLEKKFNTARQFVPKPQVVTEKDAKVGIIAFGSSHFAVEEARDELKEAGIKTSYLRVKALPFTEELKKFVDSHERVYVVEQNRDGQLHDLIALELPSQATKLRSIKHYNGLPLNARFVTEAVSGEEKK